MRHVIGFMAMAALVSVMAFAGAQCTPLDPAGEAPDEPQVTGTYLPSGTPLLQRLYLQQIGKALRGNILFSLNVTVSLGGFIDEGLLTLVVTPEELADFSITTKDPAERSALQQELERSSNEGCLPVFEGSATGSTLELSAVSAVGKALLLGFSDPAPVAVGNVVPGGGAARSSVRLEQVATDLVLSHPLLELLAAVPAPLGRRETESLSYLDYLDVRAAERARGAVTPGNSAEFDALTSDQQRLWFAATNRLAGLSSDFLQVFRFAPEMPQAVGFGFFDVDRLVAFGQPPLTSQLLQGRFDPDAIRTVYLTRDYAVHKIDGLDAVLLRRADGKDELEFDLENLNPANPFGGKLGRREPLALLSETLLGQSSSWEGTLALTETFETARPSLLDIPDYRAAAEALVHSSAAPELLVQAEFLRADTHFFGFQEPVGATLPTSAEQSQKDPRRQHLSEYQEALPPYTLAVLADGHHHGEQAALIALVYPTAEMARAAQGVLEKRVSGFVDEFGSGDGVPATTVLDVVSGRPSDSVIFETTGRAVLLAGVRYPQVTSEANMASSGLLYQRWFRALLSRSFSVLDISSEE